MARPGPSWLVVAVICVGCAHFDGSSTRTSNSGPKGRANRWPSDAGDVDPAVAALRQDNSVLRRKVAALEDRVVKLERAQHAATDGPIPMDRDLPVVRLEPPRMADEAADEPVKRPKKPPKALSRTLGHVPNSGGAADGFVDDEPAPVASREGRSGPEGREDRPTHLGKSYRLVGNRLVELTKANGPKRPDRPARDTKGTAQLTEYEAAMALYKAGELAGAERAFELFARAHPKHDYADNALYWMGEAAYDQSEWDGALAAFTEVVERYGGGNKAPDALLKIGLCYGKLGDAANARDVLSELVAAYPDARASDIARARLGELES